MKKRFIDGGIFNSNNYGPFKIVKQITMIDNPKEIYYQIEFINSGCRIFASSSAIAGGRVRDYLVPTVAGVGYIGSDIKVTSEFIFDFYKSWNDIINRCYNKYDDDYKYYGAIGIKVSSRWFNFTNFYYDAMLLPGYDKKIKFPSVYQLDKDYLQIKIPKNKRIYSPETCMWLSKYDNVMIMGLDKGTVSGYYGVYFIDNCWKTVIYNTTYGSFDIPEAAANIYNFYTIQFKNKIPFHDIIVLNDVEYMDYDSLIVHTIKNKKQRWLNDYPKGVESK